MLVESVLLVVLGGLIGMGLAAIIVPVLGAVTGGALPMGSVPAETWGVGLLLMVVIGLVVGALPSLRAMRLKIVDALAGR